MSETTKKTKPPIYSKDWLIDTIKSFAWAIAIALVLTSSIIEAYKIPTGSMIPTLMIGDHIFVNKFAYGLKVPFSDIFSDKPIYLVKRDPPKRGDVIVFKYPKDQTTNFIKRVVGLPGDTIQVIDRVLYVNEKPISQVQIKSGKFYEKTFSDIDGRFFSIANMDLFEEDLAGAKHPVLQDSSRYMNENFGPVSVPEGKLFCMGDNRDYSADSRSWGFVPFENVKGKAMFIWFSVKISPEEKQYYFKPLRIGTLVN